MGLRCGRADSGRMKVLVTAQYYPTTLLIEDWNFSLTLSPKREVNNSRHLIFLSLSSLSFSPSDDLTHKDFCVL